MTEIRMPTLIVTAMPSDTNPDGDIFGGFVFSQMDLAAGSVSAECAQGRTVTIAVEGFKFISPVFVGDKIIIYADIVKTGTTSITVKVCAYAKRGHTTFEEKVTEALFTFVKIGLDRKPKPLP